MKQNKQYYKRGAEYTFYGTTVTYVKMVKGKLLFKSGTQYYYLIDEKLIKKYAPKTP